MAMSHANVPDKRWYEHLSIDLILDALKITVFHPFVVWMLPLCMRSLALSYSSVEFRSATAWALFITFLNILTPLSQRIAYGKPREVDLNDEIIVITGGGSGLGKCMAEIYALRGATVAVIDVQTADAAEEVGDAHFYTCDVGDGEALKRTWDQIKEEVGVPTILINNAATVHGKRFLDLNPEDAEKMFHVNTLSHFRLSSLFLPPLLLRTDGGTIVTISSVLAHLGASHLSAYTASKAALLAYHSSLTAELSESYPNIKTILVTPGQLSTDMFNGLEPGLLANFLGPVVEVQKLALKLVKMIDEGRGGRLAEPAYARWIPWLAVMPDGVQKIIRQWSGVDTAMLKFRGLALETQKEKNVEPKS